MHYFVIFVIKYYNYNVCNWRFCNVLTSIFNNIFLSLLYRSFTTISVKSSETLQIFFKFFFLYIFILAVPKHFVSCRKIIFSRSFLKHKKKKRLEFKFDFYIIFNKIMNGCMIVLYCMPSSCRWRTSPYHVKCLVV